MKLGWEATGSRVMCEGFPYSFCFGLAKDICVLVIFLWNGGEVNFFRDGSGFGLHYGTKLESKYFQA